MAIFLDTSFLIAYYNAADSNHQSALKTFNQLRDGNFGRVLTSTYVLDELLTYILKKFSLEKAQKLSELWITKNNGFAGILDITWQIFSAAAKLFADQSRQDRELSFTDCTIIISSRDIQAEYIATFDSGFHKYMKVVPNS